MAGFFEGLELGGVGHAFDVMHGAGGAGLYHVESVFADFVDEFAGGEYLGDEAHVFGFLGVDEAGGEEEVHGVVLADDSGEEPGDSVFGDEASLGEGGAEACGITGESDVAVEGVDHAEAYGGSVDGAEDGLFHAHEEGVLLAEIGAEVFVELDFAELGGVDVFEGFVSVSGKTGEEAHVGSGTESSVTCAGEDDDADGGVFFGVGEGGVVFDVHLGGPGVEVVGSVEGDGGDPFADFVE